MAERKRSKEHTPLIEWVVGGLGALIFTAMLATTIWNGLVRTDAPPSIAVQVERIEPSAHGYAVVFAARNDGDVTAAQVRLLATLTSPSGAIERREATLDFIPPRSSRRGGFLFASDPRAGELQVQAQGYAEP